MAQPPNEIETDLRPGEVAIAIVAAATWFFLGPWGILPTIWFVVAISGTRLTTDHRKMLIAPIRAARALPGQIRAADAKLRALPGEFRALLRDDAPLALPAPADEPPAAVSYPGGASFTPQPGARAAPAAGAARRQSATITPERFAEDPLFRAINEEPHRLIVGHTQGGKSTAMHGMVQAWAAQGQPVYVLDPDAAHGAWPGATKIAGYAEDYAGIGSLLEELEDIFRERSEDYAAGQRDFAPMHIVADEVHETFAEVPGARKFLLDTLGRRGAKRGMLVTLGTQDQNKDSLGLESAGVLSNFITAELAKDERGRRRATVYRGNAGRKSRVQEFAVPALPGAKTFVRPRDPEPVATTHTTTTLSLPEPSPDDLLAGLLSAPLPAAQAALATVAPEREARLRAILAAQQSVTVAQPSGGDVNVIVQQVSAPGRAPTRRSATGINVRDRRRRLAYVEAARAGDKFEPTYRRLGGNRNEMHALFAENRVSPQ